MRTIEVKELAYLPLGRQGENRAQQIVWPGIADSWARRYGEGSFALTVKRQGDEAPYPASVRSENGDVIWTLNNADTAKAGEGLAELSYAVNGTVAKSKTWRTVTEPSLSADGTTEPPEPYQSWMDGIHQITESIKREEDERQAAENGRTEAEEGRILAERARAEAEEARVAAEQGRVRSDRDIQTDEGERRKAERERAEAEGSRAFAETSRNRNEGERIEAEKERALMETTRVSAERARVTAETARVTAETARAEAETARTEEEKKRQSAEWQRNTSERSREDNEQHRMLWEAGRVLAEKARSVWEQYDATHDYKEGNKVAFGGSSYLCIKDCPASASAPPPDSTYWLLIAKKGAEAFAIKLSEKDGTLSVDKSYGDILAACKAGSLVYVSEETKRPNATGEVERENIYSYSYYSVDNDGSGKICFVREGSRLLIESDGRVTLSVFGTPHYDLDDAFALGDSIPKFDRYADKLVPAKPGEDYLRNSRQHPAGDGDMLKYGGDGIARAAPNVDYAFPTLYVTITEDGQDSSGNPIYKSDKTYEEIKAAHEAGREVKIAKAGVFGAGLLVTMGVADVSLIGCSEESCLFSGSGVPVNGPEFLGGQPVSLCQVEVKKDGSVSVFMSGDLETGEWDEDFITKPDFVVTLTTGKDGQTVADKNFGDIETAVAAGKNVRAIKLPNNQWGERTVEYQFVCSYATRDHYFAKFANEFGSLTVDEYGKVDSGWEGTVARWANNSAPNGVDRLVGAVGSILKYAVPNVDYALPSLIVNITEDGKDSEGRTKYKADKTFKEVFDAYSKNIPVFALLTNDTFRWVLPLMRFDYTDIPSADINTAWFAGLAGGGWYWVSIDRQRVENGVDKWTERVKVEYFDGVDLRETIERNIGEMLRYGFPCAIPEAEQSFTDEQQQTVRERISAAKAVPVTAADNGKFLRVVDGQWAADSIANAKGVSF